MGVRLSNGFSLPLPMTMALLLLLRARRRTSDQLVMLALDALGSGCQGKISEKLKVSMTAKRPAAGAEAGIAGDERGRREDEETGVSCMVVVYRGGSSLDAQEALFHVT